jgi:hypothetical protein
MKSVGRSRPRLETQYRLARLTARLRTERFEALEVRQKAFDMDSSTVEHYIYWVAIYNIYLARAYHLSGNLVSAKQLLELAYEIEPQNSLMEVFYGDLSEFRGASECTGSCSPDQGFEPFLEWHAVCEFPFRRW